MPSSRWQRRYGELHRRPLWLIASLMVVVGVYVALLAGQAAGSPGSSTTRTPVEPCPYPDPDAVYTGGDPNEASSYACRNTVELTNPFVPGRPLDHTKAHRE